ncbi:MAG: hypothetical protein PHT50_02095 [Candidatus Omnitrophica bacterium]|nr:hypothetical protein [Candidatus Omnitrophota bacterium]MDD5560907.1 hypothetical protein [Candidatus Omnitrophota bacterium]
MRRDILGLCLLILCLSVGISFAEGKKIPIQAINNSIGIFSGEDDIVAVDEVTVFDVVRPVIFWLSPLVFLVGMLLVLYGNYKKLDSMLAKEMGIRKKLLPKMESSNYTFHEWLLEKHTLTGVICIICAAVFFFVFR